MPSADTLDPELSSFFDSVVDLSSRPSSPDVLLQGLQELTAQFETVSRYRSDSVLEERIKSFAQRRFALIDVEPEYAETGNEILILSMALVNRAELAAVALKTAILGLSHNLTAPGVTEVFGKLLKRLQGLARTSEDDELKAWVEGAIDSLPGD